MSTAFNQAFEVLLRVNADATEVTGKLNPALAETQASLGAVATEAKAAGAATGVLGETLAGLAGGAAFFGIGALVTALASIPGVLAQMGEEQLKFQTGIQNSSDDLLAQVLIWDELAGQAGKFSDVVALAVKGMSEINKLVEGVKAASQKNTGVIAGILDDLLSPPGGSDNETIRLNKIKQATDLLTGGLTSLSAEEKRATQQSAEWLAALAEPIKALSGYEQKLAAAQEKLAQIEPAKSVADSDAYAKQLKEVDVLKGQVAQLNKEVKEADQEHLSALDKAALLRAQASNDPQLVIERRVTQEYDRQLALSKVKDDRAKADAKTVADALRAQLENQLALKNAAAGTKLENQQFAGALREAQLHLEAIKGLMSTIANDPFATVFQKDAADAKLIPLAIQQLQNDIAAANAKMKGGALDPAQWEQLRAKILQDNLEIVKLSQQLQKVGSFTGGLKANLIAWANQFGNTAHQIGNLITNSIGTAIQGVSSGITGLIFHTQSLGQAFLSIAEQIVQSLIRVGLEMLVQKLFGSALASESTAETVAQGKIVAEGLATAAAYQSTISYGAAAAAGSLALSLAVADAITQASTGFASGGYTGDGHPGQVAGVVHAGEYVFSKPAVDRIGVGTLEAAHRGNFSRPSYEVGGFVGSGASSSSRFGASAPIINQALFFDLRAAQKWLQNRAGEKHIIDVVNRAGGHLRT